MNIQFDNKINAGQIVTLISAVVLVAGLYYGQKQSLSDEAHAREMGDAHLQEQVTIQSHNAKYTAELLKKLEEKIDRNSERIGDLD